MYDEIEVWGKLPHTWAVRSTSKRISGDDIFCIMDAIEAEWLCGERDDELNTEIKQ